MRITPKEELIINKIKELASKLNATVDIEDYGYSKKEIRINGVYYPISYLFPDPIDRTIIENEDKINKYLDITKEIFKLFRELKEINPRKWERISLTISLLEEGIYGEIEYWLKYDGNKVTIIAKGYYCSEFSLDSLADYTTEKIKEYDLEDILDEDKILEEVYEKLEKELNPKNNKYLKKLINMMNEEGIIYHGWSFDERFGDTFTVELELEKEIPLNKLNYETLEKISEKLYDYSESIIELANETIIDEIDKKIESMARLVH